jgi:DNA-binding Lrp family transcriptional regulator
MSFIPEPLQSARVRAGRRFQPVQELLLEGAALEACASLPGSKRGLVVLREVVGPHGIPDLVAVVVDRESLERRLASDVPPLLSELDARIVSTAAFRAPRRIDTLARRLTWPVATVLARFQQLLESGALIETGPGVVIRAEVMRPVGRLYAVEIKVDNWRRAVRQGRGYQLWCDTYVVVMETLSPRPLQGLLAATAEDGAGVMINGRWRSRPVVRRRDEWRRLWGSEHVVAAVGDGSISLGAPVGKEPVK